MISDDAARVDERKLKLRYSATCRRCTTALAPGDLAFWDRHTKSARCVDCLIPRQAAPTAVATASVADVDFGTAGASAQRLYDTKESRRRAHLRARWWAIALMAVLGALAGGWLAHKTDSSVGFYAVLGAFIPTAGLLARPQHISAWRIGAAGEQRVGRMLDALRGEGIVAIHDRRVPGRRTNIDHIAVSSAGIFVIDTKNVAGRVTASRTGLRVAGRRQDKMITDVQAQIAVVREALVGEDIDSAPVRGVLCFTKADLPWLRPAPGGIQLLHQRGLRKLLRQPGPLSVEQVDRLARLIAGRLPPA